MRNVDKKEQTIIKTKIKITTTAASAVVTSKFGLNWTKSQLICEEKVYAQIHNQNIIIIIITPSV